MTNRRTFLISAAALTAGAALPTFAAGGGRYGSFTGESGHVTTGGVEVVMTTEGATVRLQNDFSLDRAPDPKVALGKDGYDPATLMGKLRRRRGAQDYTVPAGIDVSDYNEVWIWCERFNVPLGVAKLG